MHRLNWFKLVRARLNPRGLVLRNLEPVGSIVPLPTLLPSVEVVIPTKDKVQLLKACIESVMNKNNYKATSITVVDNNSSELETFEYFDHLRSLGVSVISFGKTFNFSAICNFAANQSSADYLLFLNNDVEGRSDIWISSMVSHALSRDKPIVGKRLLYPDGTVQHAGVSLGLNGVVSHPFSKANDNTESASGKCYRVSAVSFACVLVKRSVFIELGCLDEFFKVGLNDIDFCLRAKLSGIPIAVCSEGNVIHHESATRPFAFSARGIIRATLETLRFSSRWANYLLPDKYFDFK